MIAKYENGRVYIHFVHFDEAVQKITAYQELEQARLALVEAGFHLPGGFDISTLPLPLIRVQRGEGLARESILCETYGLIGMATSLERPALQDALTEAFALSAQTKEAYKAEVEAARKDVSTRRGRPSLPDGEGRDAFVGAKVPTELKQWADKQEGGTSALINRLLADERERREGK